ncbi:hypothetical protein [Candidatus Viridilinea mediisalina]|uniref:Uncharacterized protein n=1 Tax=Candidatus Viridilinea mediisalina TaxID=2024553 RepID=A0A2A6RHM1_9CHLR|nr:hypothetical protein [Candidatus Viridilinea mediisalina]PDW02379.1 hypothetical protein CJ255_14205 [Candidatus Viridilinea mediisalina]
MLAFTTVRTLVWRFRRLFAFGLALLLVVALIPQVAVRADQEVVRQNLDDEDVVSQPLDDTANEFASGLGVSLQRVVVSNDGGDVPGDEPGAVVLAPIGQMRPWTSFGNLPAARTNHGVVALGRHIFVIAGAAPLEDQFDDDGVATPASFTDSVFSVNVNPILGGFEAAPGAPEGTTWANTPLVTGELIPQQLGCVAPVQGSRRSDVATASLLTATQPVPGTTYSNASGFIYVVGGRVDSFSACGYIASTPQVQIGRVENGRITGWTTNPAHNLPRIPGVTTAFVPGVQGAQAVVVRRDNRVFLYVLGGSTVNVSDGSGRLSDAVFFTEINPSNGQLRHPDGQTGSIWKLNPTPMPTALFDHAAVWSRATGQTGAMRDGIFVTGGFTNMSRTALNPRVYLAEVASNGVLTWVTRPGDGDNNQIVIEGRSGLAGFAYGGQIYFLGGSTATAGAARNAEQSVFAGSHNGQLRLLRLFDDGGDSREYFLNNQAPIVPDSLRLAYSGVAVVPAAPRLPGDGPAAEVNAAWAFALGGSTDQGQPATRIHRTALGGDDSAASLRSTEGWYYSAFYDVRLSNEDGEDDLARILAVNWMTSISRTGPNSNPNADLIIEFRATRRVCTADFAFEGVEWRALDGDPDSEFSSRSGVNAVTLREAFGDEDSEEFDVSCLQYRVYLSQNGTIDGAPRPAANPGGTPRLLNVGLLTRRPGGRDLFITKFEINQNAQGQVNYFDLRIKNEYRDPERTSQTAGVQEFFVILCVAYAPLEQQRPTLTVPSLPAEHDGSWRVPCAPVYRLIRGDQVAPGEEVFVNGGWRANFDNHLLLPTILAGNQLTNNDIRSLFSRAGHYEVAAIIDPFSTIDEENIANNMGFQTSTEPIIRSFTVPRIVIAATATPTATPDPNAPPTATPTRTPTATPTATPDPNAPPTATPDPNASPTATLTASPLPTRDPNVVPVDPDRDAFDDDYGGFDDTPEIPGGNDTDGDPAQPNLPPSPTPTATLAVTVTPTADPTQPDEGNRVYLPLVSR